MKKIGFGILLAVVVTACGGEKTLEKLEQDKKKLIAEHKTEVRAYKKSLHELDSSIAAHPDFGNKVEKIKKVPVTVDSVRVNKFEHFFEVHGNVEMEENASLFAEAPGNVKKIHVKEGQAIQKGQVIISLDASALESGIKELENGYALAQKIFTKQAALWAQKIGSEIQFLEAKNNKESLEQKLKTMREQLDMYKIKAPFAGIVDDISPKIGEMAAPGFPVARIMNLSNVYLEADVSEKYISTVKKGGFVEVKLPALGETVQAKVTRAGNYINPANRTFKVRVEFANPSGKYKPNQLAVLKIRDYLAQQAIIIPSRIIQQDRSGQDYVYTYYKDNGIERVKKLNLTLGISYNGFTEVLSGITAQTLFIDKGAKSVQSGDAITIK